MRGPNDKGFVLRRNVHANKNKTRDLKRLDTRSYLVRIEHTS